MYPVKGFVKPDSSKRAWEMRGTDAYRVTVTGCTPTGGCLTDSVTASVVVDPGARTTKAFTTWINGRRPDISQPHFDSWIYKGSRNWTKDGLSQMYLSSTKDGSGTWYIGTDQTMAGSSIYHPIKLYAYHALNSVWIRDIGRTGNALCVSGSTTNECLYS